MREINARTGIGARPLERGRPLDLLAVHTARLLHHSAWKEITRATHRPSLIPFRLQNFNV